jgi:hypothetical protein
MMAVLAGCGNGHQSAQAGPSVGEQLEELMRTEVTPVSQVLMSETFAFGSDSTDLQRDLLRQEIIGKTVEWDILVYEITLEDDVYKITSQPLPVKSKDAVPVMRVVIFLYPATDVDVDSLRKAKTNDSIRIRGHVQDILLRSVVVVSPAILSKK